MKSYIKHNSTKFILLFVIFTIVTILTGIMIGYNSTKVNLKSRATLENEANDPRLVNLERRLNCYDDLESENKNCKITMPGPCKIGKTVYKQCKGMRDEKETKVLAGVPYWCGWDETKKETFWYAANDPNGGEIIDAAVCKGPENGLAYQPSPSELIDIRIHSVTEIKKESKTTKYTIPLNIYNPENRQLSFVVEKITDDHDNVIGQDTNPYAILRSQIGLISIYNNTVVIEQVEPSAKPGRYYIYAKAELAKSRYDKPIDFIVPFDLQTGLLDLPEENTKIVIYDISGTKNSFDKNSAIPSINSAQINALTGEKLTFSVYAKNGIGSKLKYSLQNLQGPENTNKGDMKITNTGYFTWTPYNSGDYQATIFVQDQDEVLTPAQVTIQIHIDEQLSTLKNITVVFPQKITGMDRGYYQNTDGLALAGVAYRISNTDPQNTLQKYYEIVNPLKKDFQYYGFGITPLSLDKSNFTSHGPQIDLTFFGIAKVHNPENDVFICIKTKTLTKDAYEITHADKISVNLDDFSYFESGRMNDGIWTACNEMNEFYGDMIKVLKNQ